MYDRKSGHLLLQFMVIHIAFGAMYAISWYLVPIKEKDMSLVTTSPHSARKQWQLWLIHIN